MAFIDKFKSTWGRGKQASPIEKVERIAKKTIVKPASVETAPAGLQRSNGGIFGRAFVILQPHVTEKTAVLASGGKYTFEVALKANKVQVSAAIKAKYGILPVSVHMQNQRGKQVRFGGVYGRQAAWKKAIITLPKGKTLDIYEGV